MLADTVIYKCIKFILATPMNHFQILLFFISQILSGYRAFLSHDSWSVSESAGKIDQRKQIACLHLSLKDMSINIQFLKFYCENKFDVCTVIQSEKSEAAEVVEDHRSTLKTGQMAAGPPVLPSLVWRLSSEEGAMSGAGALLQFHEITALHCVKLLKKCGVCFLNCIVQKTCSDQA